MELGKSGAAMSAHARWAIFAMVAIVAVVAIVGVVFMCLGWWWHGVGMFLIALMLWGGLAVITDETFP